MVTIKRGDTVLKFHILFHLSNLNTNMSIVFLCLSFSYKHHG